MKVSDLKTVQRIETFPICVDLTAEIYFYENLLDRQHMLG